MATKKTTNRGPRPGYEPAKGFPDPQHTPEPGGGNLTHYPHAQGPVCGKRPTPTRAASYSTTDPTCPTCAHYLNEAKKVTAFRHPDAAARQLERDRAAGEPTE